MNKSKRQNFKSKMIKRQSDKIKSLEKIINDLNISFEQKEELIGSVEDTIQELSNTISALKKKGKEYDILMTEMTEMKKVFNQEVFKGRWRIIRWLMR